MSSLTNNELDAPPWLRVESTLMATARLVREAFDCRLEPLALNLTQASLIGYVAEFGATTQTQLADQLGIGRAAIGSVVDRLERRGLVERHPDPADRRVWRVDITAAGRMIAQQISDIDEVLRAELRRGIGREERQALSWVLTRLQQNLQSAIAVTSAPATSRPPSPSTSTSTPPSTPPTKIPSVTGEHS
ncbi:MAG: MarR family winged helix-turn-helix transcriptional regulator [Ilumatobacter sp.]|uniref:MarR family winged helix-turn-helix transcriptional regulator n=1 Tax=Ilumatobacter sp. TaxID=1967498 RepID=UPI003919F51D